MRHIDFIVDFRNVSKTPQLDFDHSLASDVDKWEELASFVVTYYRDDDKKYSLRELMKRWQKYQGMIDTAIKSSNIEGLEVLWQGIYYHGQDNPDYEHDVYIAAESGNLKTFQHVLWRYMNGLYITKPKALQFEKLKDLAEKNPNNRVLLFVQHLQPLFDECDRLHVLSFDPNAGEKKSKRGKVFYNLVETF